MSVQDIQARHDAIGEDAGGTPAMDIGDGWQAHEDMGELLAENARLRGIIAAANNALVDVCHGDHEHQIECHADTLPEEHRRVALAAQTALDVLNPIVWEMVDPDVAREVADAAARCKRGEHGWSDSMPGECPDCGVDVADLEDDVQAGGSGMPLGEAIMRYPDAWERAKDVLVATGHNPEALLTHAATAEPSPLATGSQPIWPLVIADAEALGCSRLIPDMQARDAFGRAKYGTPLTADNGRNHLADAYQEALDGVVYLRAAMVNGADVGLLYAEAMRVALRIRDAIDGREDPADTAARELGEMPDAEFAERMERAKDMLGKG